METGKSFRIGGPTKFVLNVRQSASVVQAANATTASAGLLTLGDSMRHLGIAAVAAAMLVGSASLVRAQAVEHPNVPGRPRVTPREAHELRSDRREVRRDTRELRGDTREIRQDRRELRQDTREIRHDDTRKERRADIRDRRQDQRDLRQDLRDRRGDHRDRHQDVRDLRQDRRHARTR